MPKLKVYNQKSIAAYINLRPGETRLGERIQFISKVEKLQENDAEFVLFGIPEDIGVRANYGKAGTANAWQAGLKALLNIQHNRFFSSEKLLLLGEIDCTAEMKKASNLEVSDPNYYPKMGELVESIDEVVSGVVKKIISAGKIPVIIGGGHNNAFGNIKGASEAFQKPVNVLNIDAHTDLRQLEHRHSGNGFSYALEKGFLKKYSVFGLQQNYTPQYIFQKMDASEEIQYSLFEDIFSEDRISELEKHLKFVSDDRFGVEIDCDSIANLPSSAISPSGFTVDEVRNFIAIVAKNKNCTYLHLCEAIATEDFPTGKTLSYLITDFLKNYSHA
ncbi:arginase [Salinimicrobium marinum]|uniref:Arginase n=1 Tax=Salinimicrobium marinum TaxID=680283 RepID=A0A918VZ51_9FLAO|nr:formimidoylglutamase [Salinimicrobium marinum]GHA37580.1 arginase [Salinimicrobium marinum]